MSRLHTIYFNLQLDEGQHHFSSLLRMVGEQFPHWDEKRVRYAANKVGNKLRKLEVDIYLVYVGNAPIRQSSYPYYTTFEVEINDETVYVLVVVD